MKLFNLLPFLICLLVITGCDQQQQQELPILGNRKVVNGDTVYHTIPYFAFMNQDSMIVTNETLKDKIYVTDFFFTSCPTICPKMAQQLLRVHEQYKDNDEVAILSHSIDTKYDKPPVLKRYATKLGVGDAKNWHFVTGTKDSIHGIAKEYLTIATDDEGAPGGYDHSGAFLLIDKNRQIRGHYDGTDPESVDMLLKDIQILLNEQ